MWHLLLLTYHEMFWQDDAAVPYGNFHSSLEDKAVSQLSQPAGRECCVNCTHCTIMSNEHRIVLSYEDSVLYQSDIDLLKGQQWLNDRVIAFYFDYLAQKHANVAFFGPEVTQFLKQCAKEDIESTVQCNWNDDRRLALFALNNNARDAPGGSHWSLLVFDGFAFHHLDSHDGANFTAAKTLAERLHPIMNKRSTESDSSPTSRPRADGLPGLYGGKFATDGSRSDDSVFVISAKVLQQDNSYDCGIHVLCNADAVVAEEGVPGAIKVTAREVSSRRGEMLRLIEELASSQPK